MDTTQTGSALRSSARTGVLVMLAAMFLFSLNDAMGKWLVATYSVGQVLLLRSAVALVILLPFLWKGGVRPIVTASARDCSLPGSSFPPSKSSASTWLSAICRWPMS